MSSELAYEASDEASENELLERSLSVWRGWSAIEWEDFTPIALDLHTACSIGHYEWVRSIILKNEGGIDLDRKNHGGWTPLMYACYIGHDNIVNLLINANCNMNAKNPRGHTPLMLAASCGNESVARTLVRRGAQLELVDKNGWSALFHATYAGHQNFVAFLLDAGANKDAREPNTGMTPFMEAAAEGHEIIVQLFLQHGVNVQAKTQNGHMARSLALVNGYMKIVSMIDNHILPVISLRSEPGLDFYLSSSDDTEPRKQHPNARNLRLKSQGPSIRDGPEAIARMIDRTRNSEAVAFHPDSLIPKGYVSFPAGGTDREETQLSYRDVTSPINPEDYKDSSGSRESDDFNDDSNAFTKTGAITIKSSSSSSGGLIAALGLSREGSIDSDDSHSYEQATDSPDGNSSDVKGKFGTPECKPELIPKVHTPVSDSGSSSPIGADFSQDELNLSHVKHENTLSPLKVPERSGGADGVGTLAVEEQDSGVVSPLRDYFPLDSSFPIGTGVPPPLGNTTNSIQMPTDNPPADSHQTLPQDNMTHAEIVNRFLKNLTLENSDKSNGQCGMFGNRWASESQNDPCIDSGKDQQPLPQNQDRSLLQYGVTHEQDGEPQCLKTNVSQDDFRETGNKPHQKSQGHIPFGSNVNHIQKDGPVPVSAPQRTHHPQLNHHHPLHNRHQHNTHSHYQDGASGNVRHTPPRLTSGHLPQSHQPNGTPTQFMHNLPQEYFYSDLAQHLQPNFGINSSGSAVQAGDPVTTKNTISRDYTSQLVSASNPLSHLITPLADNRVLDAQPASAFSGGLPFPSKYPQHPGTDKLALVSGFQNVAQNGIGDHCPYPQMPPVSVSPSLAAGVTASSTQSCQYEQPQTRQVTAETATSPATVMIPGHVKSQPVSSSISWLSQAGPRDLAEMLSELGLTKYLEKFEDQDVDLQVFLSLTDNDLKELGIKLFGPRKKMTNAIARWHSSAPMASNRLEQAYADKLEGEMQEMAIQLNQAYENEERLKAQVRQEQQLRSVTESCLMEERASWEQAHHILQETKASMRTMGDVLSRLRLHHKDLRKQLENVGRQKSADKTGKREANKDAAQNSSTTSGTREEKLRDADPKTMAEESSEVAEKKLGNPSSNCNAVSWELLKKSEKCLKEMQQILSNLVLNADHILKSTHNVSSMDKDL